MIEGSLLEDPATGSAACGLGMFLALARKSRRMEVEVVQGVEMGRRSEIRVEVDLTEGRNEVEGVVLSGGGVVVMEGTVRMDERVER